MSVIGDYPGVREENPPLAGQDPGEWIFTFGAGHFLFADYSDHAGGHGPADGLPVRDRFVRIKGDFVTARREMVRMFGQVWSGQYSSEEAAGAERWGLRELVL